MTATGRAVSWGSAASAVASCEAVAVAIWLTPASVHIARWPAKGPERLALLLPVAPLGVLLAIGLVVAGLLLILRRTAWIQSMSPLAMLWLWVVPFMPWIPDRLPLLLVLAGPLRWVVALAAVVVILLETTSLRERLATVGRMGRRAVFVTSLAAFLGVGLYSASRVGAGGDEPHYLIITESLLKDADLRIGNNHEQGDYRSFFAGNLRPDFFVRGVNSEIYSIHAPGLPVLLLPAYAVAGRPGAVAFIALLAALAALAMFDLSEALAGRGAALAAWAASCLTVPFLPHAWMIFPEIPGALVVAWAALWIWQPADRSLSAWAWRGSVLATLPWLHTKFAVFLIIFGAGLAWRVARRPSRLGALLAPVVLSVVLWMYSFYAIYGVFDYEAPYGAYVATYVLTEYIPHGLVGILFDQKFGLLFYSPVYWCAIAGSWLILRRPESRYLGGVLLVAAGAFVGSTARLYMFWGGSSAPARFLVPILPCLAPMVALAVARARGTVSRSLIAIGITISLAIAAVGVALPERFVLFSNPHGRARILELIQGASPLSLVVPTFTEPDWVSELPSLGAWFLAAAVALAVAAVVARRAGSSVPATAGVAGLILLVGGAVVSAAPRGTVRDQTAQRGALDLLWRFDGRRYRTFDYETRGRATQARLEELTTIVVSPPTRPVDSVGFASAPLTLPQGAYQAVIWFDQSRPGAGELLVTESPGLVFARASNLPQNPVVIPFDLPLPVRRVTVRAPDPAVASAIRHIEIVPRAIVPAGDRDSGVVRVLEPILGRDAAFVAYTDEHAYPEGGIFWSRGTAETRVLVAPGGASRMRLTLSTGPMSGAVTLSVAGKPFVVDMVGRTDHSVVFELPQGAQIVPLTVESAVMFRPSEVDPASTDTRGLGCQVRIGLE